MPPPRLVGRFPSYKRAVGVHVWDKIKRTDPLWRLDEIISVIPSRKRPDILYAAKRLYELSNDISLRKPMLRVPGVIHSVCVLISLHASSKEILRKCWEYGVTVMKRLVSVSAESCDLFGAEPLCVESVLGMYYREDDAAYQVIALHLLDVLSKSSLVCEKIVSIPGLIENLVNFVELSEDQRPRSHALNILVSLVNAESSLFLLARLDVYVSFLCMTASVGDSWEMMQALLALEKLSGLENDSPEHRNLGIIARYPQFLPRLVELSTDSHLAPSPSRIVHSLIRALESDPESSFLLSRCRERGYVGDVSESLSSNVKFLSSRRELHSRSLQPLHVDHFETGNARVQSNIILPSSTPVSSSSSVEVFTTPLSSGKFDSVDLEKIAAMDTSEFYQDLSSNVSSVSSSHMIRSLEDAGVFDSPSQISS